VIVSCRQREKSERRKEKGREVFCGERGKREKVGALLILLSFAKREMRRRRELDITTRTIRQQREKYKLKRGTDTVKLSRRSL